MENVLNNQAAAGYRGLSTQAIRRRRKLMDGFVYALMLAASALILAALLMIIVYILKEGMEYLNLSFIMSSAQEGGIWPMIVTTLYVVITSLLIALPIGVVTAVYLTEYAGNTPAVRILRLAIETLAGIPSILYGLFGLLMFSRVLGLGQSIIAGAFTLSIMILPVIIRTTEESLKSIPQSFREASLALGTTKLQTIVHVVISSALPGIVTSTILAVGRVVGESAPVLLTVGIAKNLPHSIFDSGRTLTIHLYYLTKEAIRPEDFGIAFATASILVLFVLCINGATRLITRGFERKMGGRL